MPWRHLKLRCIYNIKMQIILLGDAMKKFFKRKLKNSNDALNQHEAKHPEIKLQKSLSLNTELIKDIFKGDQTLRMREMQNKWLKSAEFCIFYIDGMINPEIVNENIIQPVICNDLTEFIEAQNLLEEIKSKVINVNNVSCEKDINKIVSAIIDGDTALFMNGYKEALIIDSKGWKSRAVTEPESARVVRGPREGFTEAIMVNLSLVRRKIKNPDLKFKFKELGERTKTRTCICYIEGLSMDVVLEELEQRLDKIKIDGIIDSGYIQELIKDAPYSPYETVGFSERPDIVAAKLLEGRVALFVDGSPFVLTVPYLVVENFQANEDYYSNYIYSSINRLIRGFTAVTSISIPALFLAVVTYHHEMLPTPLLLSISASRQGVPLPTSLSLFMMLFIFDILREVGTRMPSPIGQAVNIVGTLVLGQAAVEAKLVSAPVIIITALTGIMTLLNLNFIGATIIFRTFLLIGACILGVYGLLICIIIIYLHLMCLRSFNVPYMMNLTRITNHDGQDAWIRAPWWSMRLRPKILAEKDLTRQPSKKKGQ